MIIIGYRLSFLRLKKLSYDILLTLLLMTDTNPASLDSEPQRLPRSLSESVEALEKDGVFRDLIGEKLLVAIKGVRKVCCNYTRLWYSGGTLVIKPRLNSLFGG